MKEDIDDMNSRISDKNELISLIERMTIEEKNNKTIMDEINEQFYLINDFDGISLVSTLNKLSSDIKIIDANLTNLTKAMNNYIDGLMILDRYSLEDARCGTTTGNFNSNENKYDIINL